MNDRQQPDDPVVRILNDQSGNDDVVPDFEHTPPTAATVPAPVIEPSPLPMPAIITSEHRNNPRYLVGWRVAIVDKSSAHQQTWYGRAYDVSLGGINIHSETNLHFSDSVVLLLSMPARVPGNPPKIVEVAGESLYTILMANSTNFRIGFKFTDFQRDGKRNLQQYLAKIQRVSSLGV